MIRFVVDTVELQQLDPSFYQPVSHSKLPLDFVYIVASLIVYAFAPAMGRMLGKDMAD